MRGRLEYPEIPFDALLGQSAQRWPEKTAMVFGAERISFEEWNRRANQFGHALLQLGIVKGDRIALNLPNCPEYEIAFIGATRIGAVPTPLNPSYKAREVQHQINDSGATVLVTHSSLVGTDESAGAELPALRHTVIVGGGAGKELSSFANLIASQPDTAPDRIVGMDELAALPYSSGTTGASKGVMLTHRNLVSNALQFVQATATTEADSLILFLPLYHIYGVALMATAMASGARQVILPRFDLNEAVRVIQAEQVTELYVVPPIMQALLRAPELLPEHFASLRFLMSAAAPLAPEIARRIRQRFGFRVIQAYGMTEASPLTHMVPLEHAGQVLESVGVLAADTRCRIVDQDTGGAELEPNEVGEITIAGPQVMAGYWNAPEATAQTLQDGWLYTGDIGYQDSDGNLFVVDRKKEMIKYKAFSIAPAELEALLLEHPAVADCAVIGRPDMEAGEVPGAFVVLRDHASASREELQQFVSERVSSYKQIRRLDFVSEIPRTPSGKILRRLLKDQAGE